MRDIVFLSIIIVVAITIPFVLNNKTPLSMLEGFSINSLEPASVNQQNALVQDIYPVNSNNTNSENNSDDIWWHYPIFKLGSYAQITNNIRYPNSPDVGRCTPASMCGALYQKIQNKPNVVRPLQPLRPGCGTRIGYFTTDKNMLPFRTDQSNILY